MDCSHTRLVYVDLGVNWANTFRLYKDLGVCENAPHWEIYGFEAHPLIQPYANHFTLFLNGEVPMPPKDLPPTGSSEDLHLFSRRYNCSHLKPLTRGFKDCMWDRLETELMRVQANPRLADPLLVAERLGLASKDNLGAYPRYVLVPAAAGASNNNITISSNRIGLIRGCSTPAHWHQVDSQTSPAWREELYNVTQVDVAQWLLAHFNEDDYVVVKSDIEGAEHALFRRLMNNNNRCIIDFLAWQCHGNDCNHLTRHLRNSSGDEDRC